MAAGSWQVAMEGAGATTVDRLSRQRKAEVTSVASMARPVRHDIVPPVFAILGRLPRIGAINVRRG